MWFKKEKYKCYDKPGSQKAGNPDESENNWSNSRMNEWYRQKNRREDIIEILLQEICVMRSNLNAALAIQYLLMYDKCNFNSITAYLNTWRRNSFHITTTATKTDYVLRYKTIITFDRTDKV